jgi:predicted nucleic acid-binding Zn ribbon protein
MNDNDNFSHAGEVLESLFNRIIPEEKKEYTSFFSGWEKIAGDEPGMHVFPRDIRNINLFLESDHPLWSQQIRMRQEGILSVIRRKYPSLEIKKIRVVIEEKTRPEVKKEHDQVHNKPKSSPVKELEKKPPPGTDEKDRSFFDLLDEMRRRGDS